MNIRICCVALACALFVTALAQDPPGCRSTTTLRKSLKQHKKTTPKKDPPAMKGHLSTREELQPRRGRSENRNPVIPTISPIYLPQATGSNSAITASNGYLYVVVGQKLYKVNEKSLRTVQVAMLGRAQTELVRDSEAPRKRPKIAASDESTTPRHASTKRRSKVD